MTQASGSVAGLTASRGAGGSYFRARVIPVNTNSIFQQAVRAALASLASIYSSVLTQDQRDGWDMYAKNVTLTDRLGDPRNVSAIAQYTRSNTPRLQAGLDRVDDAPIQFTVGPTPDPAGVTLALNEDLVPVLELGGDVVLGNPTADGHLLVYQGVPQNGAVNFFKGPWRYVDKVSFEAGDPTATLAVTAFAFPLASGQKAFFRFVSTLSTGQLSSDAQTARIVG